MSNTNSPSGSSEGDKYPEKMDPTVEKIDMPFPFGNTFFKQVWTYNKSVVVRNESFNAGEVFFEAERALENVLEIHVDVVLMREGTELLKDRLEVVLEQGDANAQGMANLGRLNLGFDSRGKHTILCKVSYTDHNGMDHNSGTLDLSYIVI